MHSNIIVLLKPSDLDPLINLHVSCWVFSCWCLLLVWVSTFLGLLLVLLFLLLLFLLLLRWCWLGNISLACGNFIQLLRLVLTLLGRECRLLKLLLLLLGIRHFVQPGSMLISHLRHLASIFILDVRIRLVSAAYK